MAEFDRHAAGGYEAGMSHWLKRRVGRNADAFIAPKVQVLLRLGAQFGWLQRPVRLLDVGCGTGNFLRQVQRAGLPWTLSGCDPSALMLQQGATPGLPCLCASATNLPFETGVFEVVTAVCVFHHLPVADRSSALREVYRVLRPDGWCLVFEHNPWNPVTRMVVAQTPIDREAVLVGPVQVRRLLRQAGLTCRRTVHFMFVPPGSVLATPLDRALGWLPLGAQYAVCASKS